MVEKESEIDQLHDHIENLETDLLAEKDLNYQIKMHLEAGETSMFLSPDCRRVQSNLFGQSSHKKLSIKNAALDV